MKKLLLSVFACCAFSIAQAQIFVVPISSGQQNGTSWADGYTDLMTAIWLATPGDTIWVAEGSYRPSIDTAGAIPTTPESRYFWLKNGVVIYGGFDGTETSLSQRDPVNHKATLEGELSTGIFAEHVLNIHDNIDSTAVLDGFIVQNGKSTVNSLEKNGSGMMLRGDASFANILFRDNQTYNQGGAVYAQGSTSRFVSCAFVNNNTVQYDGGAVNLVYSDIEMYNCVFFNNQATRFGGAITTVESDLLVQNGTFVGNTGGSNVFQFSTSGTISLNNCIFTEDNTAPVVLGTSGGVANFRECLMPLNNSWLILCPTCWGGTPTFVNGPAGDFALVAGSEGIDDTLATTPVNDYLDMAGNPRLVGYSMDLGAYEFQGTVGIEMPASDLDLTVYPNPTSDLLRIQANEAVEYVTVYNMTGQKVLSATGNEIAVADLTTGMYLIQIKTANGHGAARFVKE